MAARFLGLLVVLAAIASTPLVDGSKPKGASVSVKTRFDGTSYLLEAAEFLADENPELMWKFLDEMAEVPKADATKPDDETCWQNILHNVTKLAPSHAAKALPLALASHQYAPKLQMYRQLAEQLHPEAGFGFCCFAAHGSRIALHTTELRDMFTSKGRTTNSPYPEEVFAFDHVYNKFIPEAKNIVLYGTPGTPCFGPLHTILRNSTIFGQINYIWRPLLLPNCEASSGCAQLGTGGQIQLPGWGIEAALKNTEYSAMDDSARKAEQAAGNGPSDAEAEAALLEGGEGSVVKGFRLDVLAKRRPDLRQELLTFRDHLLAADDNDDASLKVWDLKDVGLQATQRIMAASDPLALLTELSQNFPGLVTSLSRQPVNATLRSEVAQAQTMITSGATFMVVNGLALDVNSLDYYGLLERLRTELRLRDALTSAPLSLPDALAGKLMELRAEEVSSGTAGADDLRLDLGSASTMSQHVAWLNDLEKDKQYNKFPKSVTELLSSMPGRMRPMARNVFNLVVVVEPLCPTSAALTMTLNQMYLSGFPIRLGVVPVTPSALARQELERRQPAHRPEAPGWDKMAADERFTRAFLTLREAFGAPVAIKFWFKISELAVEEMGAPEDYLQEAFEEMWNDAARNPPPGARAKVAAKKSAKDGWKMLESGDGYASEVGMQLADTSKWLLAKGLARAPSSVEEGTQAPACDAPGVWWLNGVVGQLLDAEGFGQEAMYKLMTEMQHIQELVYFNKITDESHAGNVLASVLAAGNAVGRFNPRILGPDAANAQTISMVPVLKHRAHGTLVSLWRDEDEAATASRVPSVTHYVVVDLNTEQGRELAAQAMRYLSEVANTCEARVVLVVNPAYPAGAPSLLDLVVRGALLQANDTASNVTRTQVINFLSALLGDTMLASRLSGDINDSNAMQEGRVVQGIASKAGLDAPGIGDFLAAAIQSGMAVGNVKKILTPRGPGPLQYRHTQGAMAGDVLRFKPGSSGIVSNGRLVLVHKPASKTGGEAVSQEFVAEDFSLLQLLAAKYQPGALVAQALADAHAAAPLPNLTGDLSNATVVDRLADAAMVASSVLKALKGPEQGRLGAATSKSLQTVLAKLRPQAIQIPARGPNPGLHIDVVLNPLTRAAQRLSAVLVLLRDTLGPSMSLVLNPQRDITDMPLKSYYRFALPKFASPAATADSADPAAGVAVPPMPGAATGYFARLPAQRVLTLNLDVPETWLLEPVMAIHDLDNLKLADVPEQVAYAEFELEALMLTGSCVDVTGARVAATRGLQLHLGSPFDPHQVDTLVMSNLAYFQLKAAPGRWLLSLAPGRSREIYEMQSSTGVSEDDSAEPQLVPPPKRVGETEQEAQRAANISTQVVISSFTGKHMILRVKKRPGKEKEDVLKAAGEAGKEKEDDEEQEEYDPYDELYGADEEGDDGDEYEDGEPIAKPDAKKAEGDSAKPGGDVINVFTVASGHMYERLQKIMILSVVNSTKSRVKFWIIKNYCSPQHRQVIPELAAQYGFDYEFVTYKWPHWLHKQTDKQRLIWAYKILFLDVLFPLDVDRIIFVDSDQVVRTDLAELYHMDIKGAPYAYTPFCDNAKEMDEYRFWKGGFWKDHLQGKPYHISALYMVDLKRFRQTAAGDQLRVIYDQLSKDPNSLANLDQDLPNYAQHSIKIHSLPQEWLWCESWCGNATKDKAKTIDLCNNPKTKEPKLTAARRIIGDAWEEFDCKQEEVTQAVQTRMEAAEVGLAGSQPAEGEQAPEVEVEDAGTTPLDAEKQPAHDPTEL